MTEAKSRTRLTQARRPLPTPARRGLQAGAMGFTLIEMLVVIFILSILVTLVVGVGNYVYDEAGRKQTQTTMAILRNTIDAFQDEFDQYPRDDISVDPTADSANVLLRYLAGDLIDNAPDDLTTDACTDLINNSSPTGPEIRQLRARIRGVTREKVLNLSKDAYSPTRSASTNLLTAQFNDGFGNPIRYEQAGGLGGRPVLISAGPDEDFGAADPTKAEDNIRSDEF